MSILRRYYRNANLYFITNVTFQRIPILTENVDLLWEAFEAVRKRSTYKLAAWVVLPDHFHLAIDPKQDDVSNLLQRVKMSFGTRYRKRSGLRSGRLWQNRFWDHVVRDEIDSNRHIDYIHYNPVKHGFVGSPFDWEHSSIHRYRAEGTYPADWGCADEIKIEGEFGE